jgi:1,4-alpha-glucan branching enzyme
MRKPFRYLLAALLCILFTFPSAYAQVVEVVPVFPKVTDDVTITFDATEGNGALTGVAPVYAHAGLITAASTNPSDWKHVQGVWGTPDAKVLMTSLGNNRHSISYNIMDFYGVTEGEGVESLAFVFRNATGSVVGRASDGGDIFYPVYPADVEFQSVILSPQENSLALFENEMLLIKGATSQDADLYIYDNGSALYHLYGNLIEFNLTIQEPGNHEVCFQAIRSADTLTKCFYYSVIVNVDVEDPPAGRKDGLTIVDGNTAYFQLYAPGKSYVHLNGDMTNWQLRSDFQMKRSVDGNTWWIEVPDLDLGSRYNYQYVVDGTIRIGDPYSTLILDPFNDGAITSETYPDMPQYPYGLTSGMVSSFVVGPTEITAPLNPKPDKSDLIIYELLMRDFLHAHSYAALQDTLDYLHRLGVNAIELMPVQEFEGNLGWGYNPSYHMALDKYYGSADAFRSLIDACHARGIAVILDVVYNHAFGQSPLAQLYWDATQNRPSANNPWLNPVAKHDFNVGYDFNHESAQSKLFVKRVLSWWMETYGIDGFRFDLSKGFTQNNTLGNINAWGMYDQSRINILQEYADHIWSIDPDAYVILEHFADNAEEIELSSRGMMLWGNMTNAYGQGSKGFGGSDVSNTWHVNRGWADPHLVAYMESHDEERLMYKNLSAGNSAPGYNIKELKTGLSRIELVSAFFYLIPGPKMIWEFGELGYDYSINYCTDGSVNANCRLDAKPIRWDYKDVYIRQRIYDIDRALILLRQQPAVKEGALEISLASQFEKKMRFRHTDMDVVVCGNFHVGNRDIAPVFTKTGWWYEYLTGDSLQVTDVNMTIPYVPGEYHVYTTKKIIFDFDITSSIADINFSSQPLDIQPSLNQGQFEIILPGDATGTPQVYLWDMAGQKIDINTNRVADRIETNIANPTPGVYFVNVLLDNTLYTGKIVVQ